MISYSGFHGWRGFDCGMFPAEIVVHEGHGKHVAVVLQLLAKRVGLAREPAVAHTDGQVCAFHEADAHKVHIWRAVNLYLLGCRAYLVAMLVLAIAFHKLREIAFWEVSAHCPTIRLMPV